MWEFQLEKHTFRGWMAVFAAVLQGKGLRKRNAYFTDTGNNHSFDNDKQHNSVCPLEGFTGAQECLVSNWRGVPQGCSQGQTLRALHFSLGALLCFIDSMGLGIPLESWWCMKPLFRTKADLRSIRKLRISTLRIVGSKCLCFTQGQNNLM